MNRSELIAAVADQTGGDQAEARRYVDAVFETIMQAVTAGEKVLVTGFGTFDRFARPARTARNPRTGQPVDVAAAYAARFTVGRTFKERVAADRALPAEVGAAPGRVELVAEAPPEPAEAPAKAARTARTARTAKTAKAAKTANDGKDKGKKGKKAKGKGKKSARAK